jgi:hypothetical protein
LRAGNLGLIPCISYRFSRNCAFLLRKTAKKMD